jgi:hypothetical protein
MKNTTNATAAAARKGMRAANRAAYVADMRDGRKTRPATFTDRRREASRRACRKGEF